MRVAQFRVLLMGIVLLQKFNIFLILWIKMVLIHHLLIVVL